MDLIAQNYGYNRLFYTLLRIFEILYHNLKEKYKNSLQVKLLQT